MKTPDEIKDNARTCISQPYTEPCGSCKLYPKCRGDVNYNLIALLDLVNEYELRLAQVERERDAAIVDMRSMAVEDICNLCARIDEGYIPMPPHCKYANDGDCFRWRGVCEENTKEESH